MEKNLNFEQKSIEEVERQLCTDCKRGLKEKDAEARLASYGPNELKAKKRKSWFKVFLGELNNPMIFVLFAAIAVTLCVSIYDTIQTIKSGESFSFLKTGDWPDVIIILAVIFLNAFIGTIQELKAETSLEALQKMSSPEVTVIREGIRKKIKSAFLVPGDVVVLEEGDTIGADLRLTEAINLKINEASLTGESVPSEKNCELVFSNPVGLGDRENCAFMSTTVSYGRGMGIVIHTGMETEIGKIASVIEEAKPEPTPLQRILARLSKTLGFLTLGIVFAVLLVHIIWICIDGKGTSVEAYVEAILTAISLAVAAIPEGLPAVVTIVLSIGVQKMVKANTVVRKLPSVETLGAVKIVCSDKTGTLTQNQMKVVEAFINYEVIGCDDFLEKSSSLEFLACGLSLCSNATVDEGLYGDPTEIALVLFANELGLHKKDLERVTPRIAELPFDSERKMMSTMHMKENQRIIYTKGALDSILKRTAYIQKENDVVPITASDVDQIMNANHHFSARALRVLALAYQTGEEITEDNLVFVGLVAMIDPPRVEAKPAVEKFKTAGITTVMITGDHKDTAFAVASELGICQTIDQCYIGAEIDEIGFEELKEVCKKARVFARVSPQNKVDIVKAYQALGNIVSMTGDGVNDAPSLKTADIGIAMGITGTDVAKGAADMVLTDDNFASIERAVEEGRGIYSNIRKTVFFLLGSNIAEVFALFLLICLGLPTPLIAIHLLWVNLVTDSLPAIALGMQPKDADIMQQNPRNPKESIFARGGLLLTIGYGIVITLAVILAYFSCGWYNGAYTFSDIRSLYTTNPIILHQAQTMAFTTLAFCELFHMIGMSNIKKSFVCVFENKNWMLLVAFVVGILLQLFVVETPGVRDVFSTSNLTGMEWGITIFLSILPLLVHEIVVFILWIRNRRKKRTSS
ncbi:MAG: cation-translocating P-type ATPase [Anaeroplasmataceae bacterium]|nr:cation-translocating P-type ATPase [Anaeroplasmataceae bacterium]